MTGSIARPIRSGGTTSFGATAGHAVANGTWSGMLTGFGSGSAAGAAVNFTSTTADTDVPDLAVSIGGAAQAADAHPGTDGFDTIAGFSLAHDRIDLPTTDVLIGVTAASTGVTGLTVSVSNGLATFGGDAAATAALAEKVAGLLYAMNTDKKAAAVVDGGHTYVVHSDGVRGVQDTDVLIALTGVADTAAIATSAGGNALVIV